MRRIAYPEADRAVLLCPAPRLMTAFTAGGGLIADIRLRRLREDKAAARKGLSPDVGRRFFGAMAEGGETSATALELFRRFRVPAAAQDAAVAHDLDPEPAGVPARWFRDAWRIADGKVVVPLAAARAVQEARLEAQLRRARLILSPAELEAIDLPALRTAMAAAGDLAALHRVWPAALGRAG